MERFYRTVSEITDYGPYVKKIILSLPESVQADALMDDTFNVYAQRRNKQTGEIIQIKKDWFSQDVYLSKGYCRILKSYVSDAKGNKTEAGDSVTLELACDPVFPLNAEVAFLGEHNEYVLCDFRITQVKEVQTESKPISGLVFAHCGGSNMEQTAGWVNSNASYTDMPLRFGYFTPRMGQGKRPLIIWLHGAGEGGYDTTIAYTGNKVVSLSSERVQRIFGGAYVLAPQVPTMWMDDGSHAYGESGKSIYVAALKAMIDEFIALHSDIDTSRVYLGGCSNGGFMTMRMLIDYPGFFTAAFPVCEALFDATITDKNIGDIRDMPIWFTHAKNDVIVPPERTVLPTYRRLIKAGAQNIHFSFFEKITDHSGDFKDALGNPFEFFGHGSWIYMLRDECKLDYDGLPVKIEGREVTLLGWLAAQSKQSF